MKHEERRSLDLSDFVDSLITDERYSYRMDMWDTKSPSPLTTVGAIVFYTAEDLQLATYVRQHYAALHAMSGYYTTMYFFEDLPSSATTRRLEVRDFWKRMLPEQWFRVWSALGLTMSVPYMSEYAYKIADSVNVPPGLFPCVVLFRDWRQIKTERVIVPISEPLPQFFRSLCTRIRTAIDEARGDTPANEFIGSTKSIDYLRRLIDAFPNDVRVRKGNVSHVWKRPSVFLCHSTRDKDFVARLADDLRRLGLGVWFDKWEIRIGDSIVDLIEAGVRENDFLAVILSPDSVSSPWVSRELNAAYIRELDERRVIILPVLLRKCEIPLRIREKRYADFSADYRTGMRQLLERLDPDAANDFDTSASFSDK